MSNANPFTVESSLGPFRENEICPRASSVVMQQILIFSVKGMGKNAGNGLSYANGFHGA